MLALLPGWLPRAFSVVKFWVCEYGSGGWVDRWNLELAFIFFFPTESSCLSRPLGVLALLDTIQTDLVWQI